MNFELKAVTGLHVFFREASIGIYGYPNREAMTEIDSCSAISVLFYSIKKTSNIFWGMWLPKIRVHFLVFLAAGCSHVTKFWPVVCELNFHEAFWKPGQCPPLPFLTSWWLRVGMKPGAATVILKHEHNCQSLVRTELEGRKLLVLWQPCELP